MEIFSLSFYLLEVILNSIFLGYLVAGLMEYLIVVQAGVIKPEQGPTKVVYSWGREKGL